MICAHTWTSNTTSAAHGYRLTGVQSEEGRTGGPLGAGDEATAGSPITLLNIQAHIDTHTGYSNTPAPLSLVLLYSSPLPMRGDMDPSAGRSTSDVQRWALDEGKANDEDEEDVRHRGIARTSVTSFSYSCESCCLCRLPRPCMRMLALIVTRR